MHGGDTHPRPDQRLHDRPRQGRTMRDRDDFTQLDDTALLRRRAEMRTELERLPPASLAHATLTALYDRSTAEINARAREAWSKAIQGATR
jgi:hypothetical protein